MTLPQSNQQLHIGAFFALFIAIVTQPVTAMPAIIDNGTVMLGINELGHLIVDGGPPTPVVGTTKVGLRYIPTGHEATAHATPAEGWGIANAPTFEAGFANQAFTGPAGFGLKLINFSSTGSTAVSVVETLGGSLRVTHDYHPSVSANLYEARIIIQNISDATLDDVRYRRTIDWDVEPTAFNEFVTIQGSNDNDYISYASNNGFSTSNPLAPPSDMGLLGDGVDFGPDDQGSLFDLAIGSLPPGSTSVFHAYFGAADSEAVALDALATVGAQAYSLAQPNLPGGPDLGSPNTFILAFASFEDGASAAETPEPCSLFLFFATSIAITHSLSNRNQSRRNIHIK